MGCASDKSAEVADYTQDKKVESNKENVNQNEIRIDNERKEIELKEKEDKAKKEREDCSSLFLKLG